MVSARHQHGGTRAQERALPGVLYTHTALLPPELKPRGIFVNGWITGARRREALEEGRVVGSASGRPCAGTVGRRRPATLVTTAASPSAEIEWSSAALTRREPVWEVERPLRDTVGSGGGEPGLDAWLESMMHRLLLRVRTAFATTDLRLVAEDVYVTFPSLFRRYYARGGSAGNARTGSVGSGRSC